MSGSKFCVHIDAIKAYGYHYAHAVNYHSPGPGSLCEVGASTNRSLSPHSVSLHCEHTTRRKQQLGEEMTGLTMILSSAVDFISFFHPPRHSHLKWRESEDGRQPKGSNLNKQGQRNSRPWEESHHHSRSNHCIKINGTGFTQCQSFWNGACRWELWSRVSKFIRMACIQWESPRQPQISLNSWVPHNLTLME